MWVTPSSPSRIRVRSSSMCSGPRCSKRRRPWRSSRSGPRRAPGLLHDTVERHELGERELSHGRPLPLCGYLSRRGSTVTLNTTGHRLAHQAHFQGLRRLLCNSLATRVISDTPRHLRYLTENHGVPGSSPGPATSGCFRIFPF